MNELNFELFFLGKKNSEGVVEKLTHGPFVSIDEAAKYNRRNHGRAADEYGMVKTKQVFEHIPYNEEKQVEYV